MNLEKLVNKYIASADKVMNEIRIANKPPEVVTQDVSRVIGYAKAYLSDSKYYRGKERFDVGLASVAYCEGLLDALKLLGVVEFEWPIGREKQEE